MNIDFAQNTFKVKDITVKVFVPGNPKAKLMYYLSCISKVLNTNTLNRYINYSQYYKIPDSEIPDIVDLAKIFNPGTMLKYGIFIMKDFIDHGNRFLEITDETMGIHANQEFVIGGIVVRVLKVMLCNETWLKDYYFDPIIDISKPKRNYLDQIVNTQTSFYQEKSPSEFRSSPVTMICPFCQVRISTKTESSFNFLACVSCYFFGLFFLIFQAATGKNVCCFDIDHKCPECGKTLGSYKSC